MEKSLIIYLFQKKTMGWCSHTGLGSVPLDERGMYGCRRTPPLANFYKSACKYSNHLPQKAITRDLD